MCKIPDFVPCIFKENAFKELAPTIVGITGEIDPCILVIWVVAVYFLIGFMGWVQWMAVVKCQRKWIGSLIMQLIPWWSDVTGTIYLLGRHNSFSYWISVLLQVWSKSHLKFIFLSSIPLCMFHPVCEESTTWKGNFLGKKSIWTSSTYGHPPAQSLVQGCFRMSFLVYWQGKLSYPLLSYIYFSRDQFSLKSWNVCFT